MTCSGGEDLYALDDDQAFKPDLDYAVVYGFTLFMLLAMLPALRWLPVKPVAAVGKGILPEWKQPPPHDPPSQP